MKKKAAHYTKPTNKFNTKLAILVILIVIGIILIGKLTSFIIKLYSPIYASADISRNYVWDGKTNLNFILKSTQIAIVSYNPTENQATVINLPDDLYLSLPREMGKWQLGSVYNLGGGLLLKHSLSMLFGIPIEGYIVLNAQASPREVVEGIRGGMWNSVAWFSNRDSDLTPAEISKIVFGLRGVRFDRIEFLSLEDKGAIAKVKLADGSMVSVPNASVGSLGKFMESVVGSEKISVAIFNATDIPGLAQRAAQFITNLGGNVIFTGNIETTQDRSVLFIKDENKTAQVLGLNFTSRCSSSLKCDIMICKGWSSDDPLCQTNAQIAQSRAQINLVVGKDFGSRF